MYLLGIDNGSTVAKAAVFDLAGNELSVASRKVAVVAPQPGWTEIDMDGLWAATADAIREAIQGSGIAPAAIACVASTGFGNGLFLVDAAGQPVRRAIGSSDARARDYVARWQAAGVGDAVRPKTMQALWPGQPNALLAWLQDHEPETLQRAAHVLMCKDFTRLRLTGRALMERTDASGTSLLDVGRGRYDAEVLAAFGLEGVERLLPPVVASDAVCGTVTPEAAARTGLVAGTPVAGGLFDIDACALASGVIAESQLCVVAGTWSINEYIATQPVVSPEMFMTSCYAIPGYYLMIEASATSASNLEWFVTEFFAAEREQARGRGESVYDLCNRLVAETRPQESGALFLPFLYGSNVGPDAKAGFFGVDGWQHRGHVLRAIYEGVVFGHKWQIERLLRFRAPPATVRLTGGAARSDAWGQIFADALETPVEVPAGTELGALGAALCAAVAAGCHPSLPVACARMVRIARTYQPNAAVAETYRRKYARYRRLLEVLGAAWGDLAWR